MESNKNQGETKLNEQVNKLYNRDAAAGNYQGVLTSTAGPGNTTTINYPLFPAPLMHTFTVNLARDFGQHLDPVDAVHLIQAHRMDVTPERIVKFYVGMDIVAFFSHVSSVIRGVVA